MTPRLLVAQIVPEEQCTVDGLLGDRLPYAFTKRTNRASCSPVHEGIYCLTAMM